MSISTRPFGITPDGQEVTEYVLTNSTGASVSISDFGGILVSVKVPDRDGKLADVVLGFDDVMPYTAPYSASMGKLIGRVGNRIGNSCFDLDGVRYQLNSGAKHCLHGGVKGFGDRMWDVEPAEIDGAPALILHLFSEDGEMGFPGNMNVSVTYLFTDENELIIHYEADTDKTTLCNLTNHAYFNLNGHDAGTIHDQQLQINAPYVNEVDFDLIPSGKLIPVGETAYDFSAPVALGDVLARTASDPDMKNAGGVDFNYCAGRDREMKCIASLYSPATGRYMECITDQPGVQCYTGQCLNVQGKNGAQYNAYAGVALETQHYPDSIHHPQFPTIVMRPQDGYDTTTVYRFSVR